MPDLEVVRLTLAIERRVGIKTGMRTRDLTDEQWKTFDPLIPKPRTRPDEVIAPHRRNRRAPTQDKRRLKRYRRRWKIARLFAWLQNFRGVVVRYERHAENFLGMLLLVLVFVLALREKGVGAENGKRFSFRI